MKTRQLGKDGPFVPIICLGAWSISGGMGACPEDQAIRTVHASLDVGVTFIDTAEAYFTSESVLGKALRGRRQEVFLATKLSGEHTSQHIAEAIENSLRELNTDYVDLYQVHSPRPQYPIADTMADLLKLRDDGKIRYIGVSNFSAQQHVEAAQYGPLHSSQPQYHMLYRMAEEEVLPTCLKISIGVIAHSPLPAACLPESTSRVTASPGATNEADMTYSGPRSIRPMRTSRSSRRGLPTAGGTSCNWPSRGRWPTPPSPPASLAQRPRNRPCTTPPPRGGRLPSQSSPNLTASWPAPSSTLPDTSAFRFPWGSPQKWVISRKIASRDMPRRSGGFQEGVSKVSPKQVSRRWRDDLRHQPCHQHVIRRQTPSFP